MSPEGHKAPKRNGRSIRSFFGGEKYSGPLPPRIAGPISQIGYHREQRIGRGLATRDDLHSSIKSQHTQLEDGIAMELVAGSRASREQLDEFLDRHLAVLVKSPKKRTLETPGYLIGTSRPGRRVRMWVKDIRAREAELRAKGLRVPRE